MYSTCDDSCSCSCIWITIMDKKFFKDLMITVSGWFVFLILLAYISGCSSTIENLRDEHFMQGCKVTEAEAKLGYFNQEGRLVACKLKCSPKLPKDFYYKYDNNRTGCHVTVGKKNEIN